MKRIIIISQLCTLFVAFFFVVMAINSIFETKPLMDKFLSFFVSIMPAILIILIPIFFRRYYKLSGLLYIGLATVYFFFFSPYNDLSQGWPILAIVVIPLFVFGLLHIFYDYKNLS